MKYILSIALFLCFSTCVFAQYPSLFAQLEGHWQNKKNAASFTQWSKNSDETYTYRQILVQNTDTLVQTHGILDCKNLSVSIAQGVPVQQTWTLAKSTCYKLEFEHGSDVLSWDIYNREIVVEHNDERTLFREIRPEKGSFAHLGFRVSTGMGQSAILVAKRALDNYRPVTFGDGTIRQVTAATVLGFKENPFTFHFEYTYAERQQQIHYIPTAESAPWNNFRQIGEFTIRSHHVAVVPTLSLGRKKQLQAQLGVGINLVQKKEFEGILQMETPPSPYSGQKAKGFDPRNNSAVMVAGLLYRPAFAKVGGVQPELFVRASTTHGMVRQRALVAGCSISL
jgi:hypothetical protein